MNRFLVITIFILFCIGCSKSSNQIDPENAGVPKPEVSVKLDGKTIYSGDYLFTVGSSDHSKIMVMLICIKRSSENYQFYTDLSDGGMLMPRLLLTKGVQKGVYDISYSPDIFKIYDLGEFIDQFSKTCLEIRGCDKEDKAWKDVQGSCTVSKINYYKKETQVTDKTYISKIPLLGGSFKVKFKSADNKSHTLTGTFENVAGLGDQIEELNN